MFSVSASPFNSCARSLYGGWTQSGNANAMNEAALRAYYGSVAGAPTMYGDSKWANIILRFSRDAQKRLIAKKIKAATKDQLKLWRQNADWRKAYNATLARMRSPYRRTALDPAKKAAIVAQFENIDAAHLTPGELTWMSALSRVPFVANPMLPGVTAAGNNMLFSAPDYEIASMTDPASQLYLLDPASQAAADRAAAAAQAAQQRANLIGLFPPAAQEGLANMSNDEIAELARANGYLR